jgi:surface polysaccharide O-acyltransferase-like enzyme
MPTERQTEEAQTEKAPTKPKNTGRLGSLDICRGLAILAVIFIHVSGHFLSALHLPKSHIPPHWAWYALAVPNIDAQWAVPCFLMLSAFANALSLSRTPDIPRYARRRLQTAVLPYVLWSGIYIAIKLALGTLHHLSLGHIAKLLLTGTAEYHLYFFVLVIELYVLLPLLTPLFQRRPPFWTVAAGAIILQAAIYALNRFALHHWFETTIFWYILSVTLGLWLWNQLERWPDIFRRGWLPALALTLAALAVYTLLGAAGPNYAPHTPLSIALYHHFGKGFTAVYQGGNWLFTSGMSFLILALAGTLGQSRLTALLSYLGAESLAIYVMHPLAITTLDKFGVNKIVGTGLGFVIYYAACLALPLAAAWVWKQGRTAAGNRSNPPK